jgi:hypothetical protein
MVLRDDLLLPYERVALLEALRRDLKVQQELAKVEGPWLGWHQYNVRMVKRLLDAINPKRHVPAQDSARWQESLHAPVRVAAADGPPGAVPDRISATRHGQEPGADPGRHAAV